MAATLNALKNIVFELGMFFRCHNVACKTLVELIDADLQVGTQSVLGLKLGTMPAEGFSDKFIERIVLSGGQCLLGIGFQLRSDFNFMHDKMLSESLGIVTIISFAAMLHIPGRFR